MRVAYAAIAALLLAVPGMTEAFHFPWDQGHDTTDWDDPPAEGPCEGSQCDPCSSTGSPVYLPTGHFIWTETDVAIAGQPALSLTRTYNSNDPRDGMFGRGWTTNCDGALLEYVGTELDQSNAASEVRGYVLRANDGKRYNFQRSSGGGIVAPSGRFERVVSQPSGDIRVFSRTGSSRTYSSTGRLMSVSTPVGHILSYSYGSDGRLQRLTNPAGRYLAFTYNSRGRVDALSDSSGRTWRYGYDSNGNLISVTNPAGAVRRFEYRAYAPVGDGHTYYQLTRVTDEAGVVVTDVTYNGGRVTSYTEGENRYSYSYNTTTRTVTKTDSVGSQWVFTYTDTGRIASERNPLGNAERFEFDAQGNTTRYVDQLQHAWSWTYDERGRVTSMTNPANETTLFEYEGELPTPSRAVSPSGRVKQASYNAAGQLIEIIDAAQARTTFAYSADQNLREIRDALGNVTTLTTDASGLPLTVRDSLNRTTTMTYDTGGRLEAFTDAAGGQRVIEYDALGLSSATVEPSGLRSQITRDAAGRTTALTDASGRTTTFEYDTFGRVSARITSDGRRYEFRYRADNAMVQVLRPDGVTESYTYDAAKRLTSKTAGGATVTFSHSVRGELLSATNGNATVTMTYDAAGRLSSESVGGQTSTYVYNSEGERTEVRSVAGTTTFTRDNRGLLTGISAPEGAYQFTYDALARRTQLTFPNQTATTYGYDAASRLTRMDSTGPFTESLVYEHDPRGLVTRATSSQRSWTYTYDADGRVTNAAGGADTFAYTYDDAGNVIGGGRTFDLANRLTQDGQFDYSYDGNGNLTLKSDRNTGARTVYGWNAWGQLISMDRFADAISTQPVESFAFTYDALDRRLTRTVNGVTQRYVYDGIDRMALLDQSGNLSESTTFGPTIDEPLALDGAQGTRFLHANALGSIVGMSDVAATLERYEYSPYGAALGGAPSSANAFQYTARERDASDLYYYRARYYDPQLGRFLSEDPIGMSGGPNLYAYVGADPVNQIDPTGECPWCIGAGIGLGIELISQLVQNGGNWRCLDVGQLAAAAALGAVGGGLGSRGLTGLARGLSNGTKGRIGEGLSLANNWLRGSRLLGTQTRSIPGHSTIVDSTWRSIGGTVYYVESKFGTSGLTAAQRAAANAMGNLYRVERWSYPWIGNVGAGLGGAAGGAAGGAVPTGGADCGCQ